jgi:DNA-binding NtrC family response regulator
MFPVMLKQALILAGARSLQPGVPELLHELGYELTTTDGAADAIARLGAGGLDLCIVDLDLGEGEGAAAIMKARACQPAVTTIALTAHGSVAAAVAALRAGAAEVVAKPFSLSALEDAVRRATATWIEARRGWRTPGVAIIGDDPALRLALDRVEQIAGTEASVLVRGETGTGKEVIARLIHGVSARRAGPFVAASLGAKPESVVETELFGRRMAAADGGTLFFDEIGDMPRSVQARLLRVLQEREVVPTGGGAPIPVDVRVVAASRHDLQGMVAAGKFREDLYYRLDVLPIEIPPLRARRGDIPALADHFRAEINAREGRSVPGFALDVMRRLTCYHWPGNVRELENLVERLVVVAGTRMVVMGDLPSYLRTSLHPEVIDLRRRSAAGVIDDDSTDLRLLMRLVEKLRRRNVA